MNNLERFLEAQQRQYAIALAELKQGEKQSHWMWYIFPQMQGLGESPTSHYYGIKNRQEAIDYLNHPILGQRLIECAEVLLELKERTALDIFGYIDQLKLESSMTLFNEVSDNPIFANVLKKYFDGARDSLTLKLLKQT
ncbi:hypothetical protein DOJK_00191 [Patescibacteria group bacterium]|nr:hypothetical protein DOJK_00191 [Patescibacteria group bacterium]